MTDDLTAPLAYMARTRAYYLALGYDTPYVWAQNSDNPFQPLVKPLAETRVALVTTAAPFQPDKGDQGPGAAYNGAAKFFDVYRQSIEGEPDVRISHIAYDRAHTSAHDPRTWFPLAQLKLAVEAGRLGSLTPHFYGAPTNRSQKTNIEKDAPQLEAMLRGDGAEAAILVANCPVCHQTVTLMARHLEANGIATVVMGCAKDIVEHAGVPRFLFSDFPLGNAAGLPDDPASQQQTLAMAMDLFETAKEAGAIIQSPLKWPGPEDWKLDYSNPDRMAPEELARRRAEFDQAKIAARVARKA